jgi:uncharacterized membrane protein YkvA (DUF1232 family)
MTRAILREVEACPPPPQLQSRQTFAEKVKSPVRRFFAEFRVMRRALRHPQVPLHAKLVTGCAFLYVVSPIQIIPNFIPIIGQMDDVLVVGLAIKFLKRSVPADVLEDCRKESRARLAQQPQQES